MTLQNALSDFKRTEKKQVDLVFNIVCFIAGYLGQCQTSTGPNFTGTGTNANEGNSFSTSIMSNHIN